MSKIKGKNTLPEKIVQELLKKMKIAFSTHVKMLPGTPDIIIKRMHKAIFIHGCYWHGHKNCSRAAMAKTNKAFWSKKIQSNIKRDRRQIIKLKKLGWKVMVIWQCALKKERIERNIHEFVER